MELFLYRSTLGNQEVIRYINTHTLFWACNIKSGEGFKVAEELRAGTYPFLAVIVLKDNKMTIVGRYLKFMNKLYYLITLKCECLSSHVFPYVYFTHYQNKNKFKFVTYILKIRVKVLIHLL